MPTRFECIWRWEPCSASCGNGTQVGTKEIFRPAIDGVEDCSGKNTTTCNTNPCSGKQTVYPDGFTSMSKEKMLRWHCATSLHK